MALRSVILLLSLGSFLAACAAKDVKPERLQQGSFFDLSAKSIEGENVHLADYRGKVVVVVNTASKCGFALQYKDLESLYNTYKAQGLEILAFPSNDFLNQEPGSNKDVEKFCRFTNGVSFPVFEKNMVTGEAKQPVYRYLTENAPENYCGEIAWNFEKFLLDRNGVVRARFGPFTNPVSSTMKSAVEALLHEKV